MNIGFIRYGCRNTPQILAAGLPVDYVESEQLRINIYRSLTRITNEEKLKDFHLELADRFGKLPPEAENLLTLTLIKILAARAGFTSLTVAENRVLLRKHSVDTYRSDGKLPRLDPALPPAERLKALLRIVRLAYLEYQ